MKRRLISLLPLVLLGLYLWTMPTYLTAAHGGIDGGELAFASFTNGVAHPPGYGVYTALGSLFIKLLPFGTVIQKLTFFSALATSLTCLALALSVPILLKKTDIPYFIPLSASLFLGLSRTVWQQAVITEVYAFALCLFALLFALLSRWQDKPPRWYDWFIVGHLLGIALTHHLTALLYLPALLFWAWGNYQANHHSPQTGNHIGSPLLYRQIGMMLGGFFTGLWGWLWIVWRSAQAPLANWGDVAFSFQAWYEHITGAVYQTYLNSPSPLTFLSGISTWFLALADEWTWFGFLALLLTWLFVGRRYKRFALLTLLLVLPLAGFTGVYQAENTTSVYRLPVTFIMALWGAIGLYEVWRWQKYAAYCLSLVFCASLLLVNTPQVNLRDERSLEVYVEDTFSIAPENSVILTWYDEETFPLWYAHYVEGLRPDVLILDRRLLTNAWYLRQIARHYPDLGIGADFDMSVWIREQMLLRPILSSLALPYEPLAPQEMIGMWSLSQPLEE